MKKYSPEQEKEFVTPVRNTNRKGHQPAVSVRRRTASKEEAANCERALGRLLAELVRQDLVLGTEEDEK